MISFILFLLLFLATTTSSKSYISITYTLFYPKTSLIILTFLFLFTSFLVAKRGLNAIGNVSWLIIPTLEITFVILLIAVWKEVNWLRLFPLAGTGGSTLIKESLNNTALFGEIILLAAFYPFMRSYKSFQFASILGMGISLFKIALFLAVFVMVFDYPHVIVMAYPFHELTRIAEFGPSLTHVEGVFFLFWLVASVIRFAIYLYLTAFLLGGALRMEKYQKLLLPLAGLIALGSLLPENTFTMNEFRELLIKIGSWHSFPSLSFSGF